MQPMGLEVTTRALPDGAVIELRGDIDGTARETLAAAYDSSTPTGSLLLDFEHVAYINSTGIASIVDLLARACADERSVGRRPRTLRPLQGDLPDRPHRGLHDAPCRRSFAAH